MRKGRTKSPPKNKYICTAPKPEAPPVETQELEFKNEKIKSLYHNIKIKEDLKE